MARTVDTSSTFEQWRQNYNNLVADVGDPAALTTGDKANVVSAINYIMDQYFFFQDFDFDGSDGASSNTVFSGTDNAGNTLQYMSSKVLVYKNGLLLRSGTDYTAVNGTSITLAASANNSDVVRISSYTGSYTATPSGQESNYVWSTAGGVIHNRNDAGIVFNSTSTTDTTLDVANSFQFNGSVYFVDDTYINNQKDLRFKEASGNGSNYVAIQAPASISTNRTLTLPDAEDGYMVAVASVGSNGYALTSDGDGSYSWTAFSGSDTTYSQAWVDDGDNAILRLDPSTGSNDDLTIVAGSGITVTPSGDNLTIAATAGTPTVITVADESSDTTCFPAFFTTATGDQAPKTGSNLTFNSANGTLTATTFAGALTGNVTGNVTGNTSGTSGSTSGNAATATALATGRTIGGVSFDGTANINLPGVNAAGNQATSGLAATATALATGRTIGMTGDVVWTSASFDGTANVTGSAVIQTDAVDIAMLSASGTASSSTFLRGDNTWVTPTDTNTQLSTEQVQDIVGGMFSSNTETRIAATYQDGDGTIDLVVDDMSTAVRTVTAGGNTLASGETLAFTQGTGITISESGGAVTITNSIADTNLTTEEVQDIVGAMTTGNTESGITVAYQDDDGTIDFTIGTLNQNTSGTAALATSITSSANNSTNETVYPTFVDGATGTQGIETDTGLTYNPSTGMLTTTGVTATFTGNITGNVTGNTSGTAATVTTAAQTNITSLGTLTALTVDNLGINGNTITANSGALNLTPAGGSAIVLDGTINVDAGVVTGATSITSTAFVGGLTGNVTGNTSGTAGVGTAVTATVENSSNTAHYIPFFTGTSTGSKNLKFSTDTTAYDTGLKYIPGDGASDAFGTIYVDRTISSLFYISATNQMTTAKIQTPQLGVNVTAAGTDGRIDAGNDIVAFSSSDIALKENINPISNALDKVLSLGGYTFDWKKEREEEHGYTGSDIGVLAQEVEDILPTAVRDNCYGNKSVRMEKLIPLLIESIKELKTEIESLKNSKT